MKGKNYLKPNLLINVGKDVYHNCYIKIWCYETRKITLVESVSRRSWVSYEWNKTKQLGTLQES